MNKELLGRIIDSLSSMIDYADDGIISRGDPNFKDFFEELDKANDLLNELYNMWESEENNE